MTTPIENFLDQHVEWKPVVYRPEVLAEFGDGDRYASHEGVIHLAGGTIRVYQLNDGSRVVDADDVARLFGGVIEVGP